MYAVVVLLLLLLTGIIAYGTYRTAQLLRHWQPDGNLLLLPGENLLRLALIGLCLGLGLASGLEWTQLGWSWTAPLRQLLGGAVVGSVMALFFAVSTRWLVARTGQRFYSPLVIDQIVPTSPRELGWVCLALLPVVVLEELLFRSLWLGVLGPLLPAVWLLLISGLLFGFMHSPQGVWGMVGAAGAGILFGLLFLWQGSLLMPLVAHYVANLLQIGMAMGIVRHSPKE